MEEVTIHSEIAFTYQHLRSLLATRWKVQDTSFGDLMVDDGLDNAYLAIEQEKTLRISYHNEDFVHEVLKVVANTPDLIVDNEYGTIMPGDDFVEWLRVNPDWRWTEQ